MKITTKLWLILSSFGIMFAVFSWIQDSSLISTGILQGSKKGFFALISGLFLYKFLAKKA